MRTRRTPRPRGEVVGRAVLPVARSRWPRWFRRWFATPVSAHTPADALGDTLARIEDPELAAPLTGPISTPAPARRAANDSSPRRPAAIVTG